MITILKSFYKNNRFLAILISVTAPLILATGIYFKMDALKLLPLFVSLIIMVLSAQVNRYALLLGSFNSLVYSYYYYSTQLYSTLAYAVLVSFPMQLIAFINWNRNSKGSETSLKKMSKKQILFTAVASIVSWILLYVVFALFGSPYIIVENTGTLLGVLITLLSMLRFSEYASFQLINGLINIILHLHVTANDISNIPYVIFSVYSYICLIMAFIRMHKTHRHIIVNRDSKKA